jgi:prepilin-type N-terminal cleavage/methylation domain-containing protein
MKIKNKRGYSLIELIVVIGILAITGAGLVVLVNPFGQLANSRNDERRAHIELVLDAIGRNMLDNNGVFVCQTGDIPTSSTKMATDEESFDIAPCVYPDYTSRVPYDSMASGAHYTTIADYDTGYFVVRHATSGRITISAPSSELGEIIFVTR